MPVTFTNGVHNYVTIKRDAHGCIHMWEGRVFVNNHPTLPLGDGREADTFIQRQDSIEELFNCLDSEELGMVETGWSIHTRHIPDDYLVHEF